MVNKTSPKRLRQKWFRNYHSYKMHVTLIKLNYITSTGLYRVQANWQTDYTVYNNLNRSTPYEYTKHRL